MSFLTPEEVETLVGALEYQFYNDTGVHRPALKALYRKRVNLKDRLYTLTEQAETSKAARDADWVRAAAMERCLVAQQERIEALEAERTTTS